MTIIEDLESRNTLLTAKQVATVLQLHRQTIYRMVEKNQIPYIRLRGLKFDPRKLAAWLRLREVHITPWPKRKT